MSRKHAPIRFCMLLGLLSLSGCADYAFTLNEKVLYMPPSLFTDYDVPDHHLRGCLVQTISDQQVTEAAQLRHLNCSSAGISQLTGLTRFHALEELNLASNNLREVPELAKLNRLRILILRDNPLTDASPLLRLLNLQQLDLSQTPDLTCADVQQLAEDFTGELILPEQCG